jgi:hypothetical protein
LADEHIPERRYSWEDLVKMPWASEMDRSELDRAEPASAGSRDTECRAGGLGQAVGIRQGVRRIFCDPCPLPTQKFDRYWGPYLFTGRWWSGEGSREYYYAETKDGEIHWLCFDRTDGLWRQIGVVE